MTTATTELDGSSGTGGYGPPYNHAADGQHIAFIYLQKWLGVSHPINTAQDFVLAPLRSIPGQPALQSAISAYKAAPREARRRVDDRVREGARQSDRRTRTARSKSRPVNTARCRR